MTTETEIVLKVIKKVDPPSLYGNIIAVLTHTFYYVRENEKVRDVADDLKNIPGVFAIGVVDESLRAVGVLPIQSFLSQMARPYAHELLSKRPISELMREVKSFSWDKNILTVAEKLDEQIQEIQNNYFLLHNEDKTYLGVFTSKDLLIHLYNNFKKDLNLATSIQKSVVKDISTEKTQVIHLLGSSTMAKGVGGDFYSFRQYETGRWALSLADVSGKGMGASLVTTILGGMFNIFDFTRGIKPFLLNLNSYILATFAMEKYLTGAFLDFNEKTGELIFYDMGHAYIYIFRKGKFLKSNPNNPFIGFLEDIDPKGQKITLEKEDLVVIISDGIPEQQNAFGAEYGQERFEKFVQERWDKPLEEIRDDLLDNHKNFRKDHPRGDDITMLLMRFHP